MTQKPKYERCKKCKELVSDAANCGNCAALGEHGYMGRRTILDGPRPSVTLDMQERTRERDQ